MTRKDMVRATLKIVDPVFKSKIYCHNSQDGNRSATTMLDACQQSNNNNNSFRIR